ncbi:2-acylglycerol O-acyltransferase 2-A [Hypsibius exemplaris]|uniref:Acyltransferase n=1 Tax=Hypsibius exemplaris TaxID=2072580 RepID=A0A1W0WG92_HYPEX|nr:2-acylglycerol O-acyltransferase 2-A [Hypsibius exemplaris]
MGRKIAGVELAPLNMPLHRRIQTLCAFTTSYLFFFGGLTSILFLLFLLHTKYYWITLLYVTWFWFDRDTSSRGGRPSQWLRNSAAYRYLRDYFPISLVKTADLDPKENYLIGYHPHGIMGFGTSNFVTEATGFSKEFPGIKSYVLTLKLLHYLPFYREYISAIGYCDVSKDSIDYILRTKGNAVVILIGGAKESLDANPSTSSIVLKNRKGFVKMALKNGAHLVPSYTFGENELFRQAFDNKPGSRLRRFQRFFQSRVGYAPICVTGRGFFQYSFGIVPHRVPLITVVGKPIHLTKTPSPSQEDIDKLHDRYMVALKDLFDEHKTKYGYGEQTIEFIE